MTDSGPEEKAKLPPFGAPWWVHVVGAVAGMLGGRWVDTDGPGLWIAGLGGALFGALAASGIYGSWTLGRGPRPNELDEFRAAHSDNPDAELESTRAAQAGLEQLPPPLRTYMSVGCFPTFLVGAAIGLVVARGSFWALLTVPVGAVLGVFIYAAVGTFALDRAKKDPPHEAP